MHDCGYNYIISLYDMIIININISIASIFRVYPGALKWYYHVPTGGDRWIIINTPLRQELCNEIIHNIND